MRHVVWVIAFALCATAAWSAEPAAFPAEQVEFFETQVRPLLVEHCQKCHGPDKQQADLRLDTRELVLKGGENGPALVPSQVEASRLITAVRYQGDLQMPPDGKLGEAQIAVLEKWVALGAPWGASHSIPDAEKLEKQRNHWAFQPVKPVTPPAASDPSWYRTPVDQFILAALEQKQLAHSPAADRRTLIRRVTYDLTGLPPTPEAVEAFVKDTDPEAYPKLVDRLLQSPQYGEQWARHWLDVARYSDTKGYVYAREERFWVHAPAYRDWVVRALNDDMPYDRFLALQIAADQIAPDEKPNLAAMGFLTLGRRFLGVTHDIYDDRIDVVTRGTMGLTASCARCHDHKYDPIPTADYYSLYGVFLNSYEELVPISTPPEKTEAFVAVEKELQEKTQKQTELVARKRAEAGDRQRSRIADYLIAQTEIGKYPQEGFDIILSTNDLIPALVWRWESYITAEVHAGNPVWGPWARFAELKPEEFAERAAAISQELTASGSPLPPGEGLGVRVLPPEPVNPMVVSVLQPPPASMREVAERYGKLLTEVNQSWTAALEAAKAAGTPAPTALPDPAAEAVRQVLYSPLSPCVLPDESIVSTETLYDSGSVDEQWKQHNEIDRTLINNPTAPVSAVILKDREPLRPNRILRRGNPATKVGFVDRHFLSLITGPNAKAFSQGSGRRELAQAIIDPANPLTARVWVNRIWQHHFGLGLVRTSSDFGIRAENPSHPELLDWLATQLIQSGWSTKSIHRLIVLSSTYQQSSTLTPSPSPGRRGEPEGSLIDPENRLLWRMNVHRLTWEEFRDTLLATSGQLDPRMGGRSADLFAGAGSANRRRTLYGTVDRQFLPSTLRMFDFANPDLSIPARSETTVPQQALFSLNHPLMAEKARSLAAHAKLDEVTDPAEKLRRLYRAAFQRKPTSAQREAALAFISHKVDLPPPTPSEESKTWSYGYGELDEAAGALKGFTPLPYFNGHAWQGGVNWPDAALGWVQLHARGGHPGNDRQHATSRRWTAPKAGTFTVTSKVTHEVAAGDGIRCFIVSNRGGILAKTAIHNRSEELNVASVSLNTGDTIDFIVDLNADLNSEQHFWAPMVQEITSDQATAPKWDAERDFTGPPPVFLTDWEQLAQVLLLSNELMFVD